MNGPSAGWRGELPALCEGAIEGRLTAEQRERLERLVLEVPEARRYYTEALHQHATLHWSAADPAFLDLPAAPDDSPGRAARGWARRSARLAAAAMAAAVLLGAVGWMLGRGNGPGGTAAAEGVATLAEAKACKWGAGSLPTEAGSRLPAGRLRLAEGLARLRFDDGAELTLEGPADLEILSRRRCVLHSGRLVGRVPAAARGFTVETPAAVVTDLGTEFGVNVRDADSADVQVFEGRVDVRHRRSGATTAMMTGANRRFGPEGSAEFDPLADIPAAPRPPARADDGATRVLDISTAMGRGKDAYVQPPVPTKQPPEALLLVKNTTDDRYARKAYLTLDLAPTAGLEIAEAELSLTFAPTGLGYASEVPDAAFAVYGLADEALDGWDERAIRWDNAPANRPGGAELDPAKVVLLGRFIVSQGVAGGPHGISGGPLADFLRRDTNGLATFIVVRETKGSGRSDLVHGFAGRRHAQLPPPTLKLAATPKPAEDRGAAE